MRFWFFYDNFCAFLISIVKYNQETLMTDSLADFTDLGFLEI